ncbi:nickel import ATP-binding protein NikD [Rhodococcus opacus PD630]|uniref:ABC transporter ATP-binding protein n=1 Tax=Rhodococcus opacus TaxID=37919 RepID=UPI00029CB1C6|nr:ABC transporter ATP-binding protein [Rhodococcus opacus]AHK29152.1 Putative peptide import ATP-binding protein [Rhodococcus opacus PD630]EHI43804.1 nickel import ATP-binding protein NikD [Rhodococcus opacus PD630]UDG98958.1 ABC transporter ATP-binding protein [Rhodococcus opacus PD630]
MTTALVEARGLTVRIPTRAGTVHAVSDIDLRLDAGQVHALVGESGCGKSIIAATLCGLLPATATTTGTVTLSSGDAAPTELVGTREKQWRRLRGRRIALVPQSAATFLTPVRTVGDQLTETLHHLHSRHTVTSLLIRVGLPDAVAALYPHQLSGGMAQRAAIAFALAGSPSVIVADEPTSNLDPQLTSHVLDLLDDCAHAGAAVLLITHDLAALPTHADRLSVMHSGRIVETGPTTAVLDDPWHPYTRDLLAALPERGLAAPPEMPPELTNLPPDCVTHPHCPVSRFSAGPTALDYRGDRAIRRLIGAPR